MHCNDIEYIRDNTQEDDNVSRMKEEHTEVLKTIDMNPNMRGQKLHEETSVKGDVEEVLEKEMDEDEMVEEYIRVMKERNKIQSLTTKETSSSEPFDSGTDEVVNSVNRWGMQKLDEIFIVISKRRRHNFLLRTTM